MTNYHDPRHRRNPAHSCKPRFKRPLVVLTYRDDQLTAIHSSTPILQFVRLDVSTSTTIAGEDAESPAPSTARQLSVPLFAELPAELHQTAQRAFRRS